MVRTILSAVVLFALAYDAYAATVYKCGNNYSNVPCDNAKTLDVGDAKPINSANNAETDECIMHLKVSLFDPDSAKVQYAFRAGGGLIDVAGQKIYAKKYLIGINAKNRYGGYVGTKLFSCYVSEATGHVLQTNE
jgi:hypothetical protein